MLLLDGEIVVINDKGISNFGNLQNWRSEADGELVLYLFDVLWLDGYSLMHLPLTESKEILKSSITQPQTISASVKALTLALLNFLKQQNN